MKMGFGKERCQWKIILDFLAVIVKEHKVRKTRIMQKAFLDWRNFKKYFVFLQENGFIAECNMEDSSYEITENGRNLLKRLKEVDEILEREF